MEDFNKPMPYEKEIDNNKEMCNKKMCKKKMGKTKTNNKGVTVNTLKIINKFLNDMFGVEIERVSDINNPVVKEALSGIKFILRGGGFNEDFETFKDVNEFVKNI